MEFLGIAFFALVPGAAHTPQQKNRRINVHFLVLIAVTCATHVGRMRGVLAAAAASAAAAGARV